MEPSVPIEKVPNMPTKLASNSTTISIGGLSSNDVSLQEEDKDFKKSRLCEPIMGLLVGLHISIANANGGLSSVTRVGVVMLSPTLLLSNTLFVPSFSHKLLPNILTKEIIGHSTKRWDYTIWSILALIEQVICITCITSKGNKFFFKLGHLSFGYLKHTLTTSSQSIHSRFCSTFTSDTNRRGKEESKKDMTQTTKYDLQRPLTKDRLKRLKAEVLKNVDLFRGQGVSKLKLDYASKWITSTLK
ncbi:hypothetical protein CR513_04476, partial [Mucuna pruriens]